MCPSLVPTEHGKEILVAVEVVVAHFEAERVWAPEVGDLAGGNEAVRRLEVHLQVNPRFVRYLVNVDGRSVAVLVHAQWQQVVHLAIAVFNYYKKNTHR